MKKWQIDRLPSRNHRDTTSNALLIYTRINIPETTFTPRGESPLAESESRKKSPTARRRLCYLYRGPSVSAALENLESSLNPWRGSARIYTYTHTSGSYAALQGCWFSGYRPTSAYNWPREYILRAIRYCARSRTFSHRVHAQPFSIACVYAHTHMWARAAAVVASRSAAPRRNEIENWFHSRARGTMWRETGRERGRHFSDGRLRGYCPFVTCSLSYSGDRWLEGFFYRFGFLWRVYRRWLGNGRDVVLDAFKKLSVWTETRLFGIIFISKKVRNIKICFEECIFHMLKNFFFCAWKFLLPACIRRNGLF